MRTGEAPRGDRDRGAGEPPCPGSGWPLEPKQTQTGTGGPACSLCSQVQAQRGMAGLPPVKAMWLPVAPAQAAGGLLHEAARGGLLLWIINDCGYCVIWFRILGNQYLFRAA